MVATQHGTVQVEVSSVAAQGRDTLLWGMDAWLAELGTDHIQRTLPASTICITGEPAVQVQAQPPVAVQAPGEEVEPVQPAPPVGGTHAAVGAAIETLPVGEAQPVPAQQEVAAPPAGEA